MGFGGEIFNFIGAVVRCVYGTTWRTIAGRKKYTFKEYLRGPNGSDDWFDMLGHELNNKVIGVITFVVIVYFTV